MQGFQTLLFSHRDRPSTHSDWPPCTARLAHPIATSLFLIVYLRFVGYFSVVSQNHGGKGDMSQGGDCPLESVRDDCLGVNVRTPSSLE